MMKIFILAVGTIKDKFFKDGIAEYEKRLSRFCNIEIIETKEEKIPNNSSAANEQQIKAKEAENIARHIKTIKQSNNSTAVIALDLKGKQLDSEGFAKKIESYMNLGTATIIFIIGGSIGLDDKLVKSADFVFSMSALTFPHRLARLILIEQIYRAFKIQNGETYHK
jgi:23S rRNA (pseudouridine1915-N3)-methyltransferase